MTFYLDLFWVKMHETTAPAVHRASFRPNQAPTPLLLSMVRQISFAYTRTSHGTDISALSIDAPRYILRTSRRLSAFSPTSSLVPRQGVLLSRVPSPSGDLASSDRSPHRYLRKALQQYVAFPFHCSSFRGLTSARVHSSNGPRNGPHLLVFVYHSRQAKRSLLATRRRNPSREKG